MSLSKEYSSKREHAALMVHSLKIIRSRDDENLDTNLPMHSTPGTAKSSQGRDSVIKKWKNFNLLTLVN